MSPVQSGSPQAGAISDLLTQASSIMVHEGGRLYSSSGSAGHEPDPSAAANTGESLIAIAARICPVTGAAVSSSPPGPSRLRQQAHELVAGLLGGSGQPGQWLKTGSEGDGLRRQAHEFIETLLAMFSGGTERPSGVADAQVPLLRCPAPVQAGRDARVGFRVANEEDTPSEVMLYSTDFISDSGHEIPALRITVLPRRATIAAKGEAEFGIIVGVPQQTPPGYYSGLIQAMGHRHVKAVLMVEVT